MTEMTANIATRSAFRRAHCERARAARAAWGWLFGSR